MKTHYASVERGNESNPHDEWFETACGLEYTESPLSNDIRYVTCKKCLSRQMKWEEYVKNNTEKVFNF